MSSDTHSYRLYRMNALTGDIRNHEEFAAWSDDEAIGRALDAAGDYRVELWREGRKLVAISGDGVPSELTIATAHH
jgi:hypothetical protein